MRRAVSILLIIAAVSVSAVAGTLVRTGIDRTAEKYRPLQALFHSLSSDARIEVYNKALRLFEHEVGAMGMKLTAADRVYWKKTVGQYILRKGDLPSGSMADSFVRQIFTDSMELYRDVARLCERAGGNADKLVRELTDYMQRRKAWIDDLRGRVRKLQQVMKQPKFDSSKMMRIIMNSGFMDAIKNFKKATEPYDSDARAKALFWKIHNLK